MKIEILEQDQARKLDLLVALTGDVFDDSDPAYVEDRLPNIIDPMLVVARDEHGLAGFKFGYREGTNFYSWLGGIHPRVRRQGLASRLMLVQHEHVQALGYTSITTRTHAANRPMIILNLKCGFEIVGFEINGAGFAVISQRKSLGV